MLETSGRLLRLLSLLQTPREWTGSELADRLEVTARTVRKDVERLRALGYPVIARRGPVGGYRLGAGSSVPPLLLDDEEAIATVIGLRRAADDSIAGIEESSLRALAKLEQVLPARLRRRVGAVAAYTVVVPRDGTSPTIDPELLGLLTTASHDREQLRFDYVDHGGATSRRVTEPHRVVSWGRRWYLLGFDLDRQDWRTYRVDRMHPCLPTGPHFAPRDLPDDDAAAWVSSRVSAAAWRYRARFTIHASAATVAGRITPAVGDLTAVDDHTCLLDSGADTLETMAVHVGMLGLDFTVDGPPELVEHLRTLAERYDRAIGER